MMKTDYSSQILTNFELQSAIEVLYLSIQFPFSQFVQDTETVTDVKLGTAAEALANFPNHKI